MVCGWLLSPRIKALRPSVSAQVARPFSGRIRRPFAPYPQIHIPYCNYDLSYFKKEEEDGDELYRGS
jgi:hypothetical protein